MNFFSLPEWASDISKILIPLSIANLSIASAWSSGTPGENTGHVPKPTFDTRKPLLPKFLYRKPGVGVAPCLIGSAGFDPRLIERPIYYLNERNENRKTERNRKDTQTHTHTHTSKDVINSILWRINTKLNLLCNQSQKFHFIFKNLV